MKKLFYLLVLATVISCSSDEDSTVPELSTVAVSNITQTMAQSGGSITSNGGAEISSRGIVWSTQQNPTISLTTKTTDGSGDGTFTSSISSLISGTSYYVRAYATNSVGTAYGNEVNFSTSSGLPEVSTNIVSSIGDNGAISGGEVVHDGGEAVSERGLVWSTQQNPTIKLITKSIDGEGEGVFTSNIDNLIANTTYFVRAYATNPLGTAYGEEYSFTTTSNSVPELNTIEATVISGFSALSGGVIVTDGGFSITDKGVCWSTNPNPTLADNFSNDGSGATDYNSQLVDLIPGTTYYYRAYATNTYSTGYGMAFTLETLDYPNVETDEITDIYPSFATCGGTVIDDGGESIYEKGLVWSLNPLPTVDEGTKLILGSGLGQYSGEMTNLIPSTIYYVRAYAINQVGVSYGEEKTFTTLEAEPPSLSTNEITSLFSNKVTSGGEITYNGGLEVTQRGVVWNTEPNPTIDNNIGMTSDGSGSGSFTSLVSDLLTKQSDYYLRAYASNEAGVNYGNEINFSTSYLNLDITYGSVTDIEGNKYATIIIGNQEWMAENLRTQTFSNGTPAYSVVYNNNDDYEIPFGRLYYRNTAVSNLCPTGWHLPSVNEWNELINYLGGIDQAAPYLKSIGPQYWITDNSTSNNNSGFSAVAGGEFRPSADIFQYMGQSANFWTSTSNNSYNYTSVRIYYLGITVSPFNSNGTLFSVRCVKD